MNLVDFNPVKLTLPYTATHTYTGDRNEYDFRNGDGLEFWKKPQKQYITGNFLQDSLHNIGTYNWCIKNEKYTYEGKFYANKLEGYGKLIYPDGRIYEGLFLLNRRYGPGVLTYADGNQDVGLWIGNSLVRLNHTLTTAKVPTLAKTIAGKAYLLKYKQLVPISKQIPTETETLILELAGGKLIQEDRLFSTYIRNSSSLFFNTKQYNDNYYTDTTEFTIPIIDPIDENIITNIIVTDLLTWNNEPLAISIMKHSFKHRNYENLLSYQVSDVLTGQRNLFNEPGPQEVACIDFLTECSNDSVAQIKKLICQHDLYLDLTDSLGNTGMTYAAAYDQKFVIKLLVNFGANIDHLNDECLTPLLLCLLRYLCCKFDVIDWENAFIPQVEIEEPELEIQEWRNIPFVPEEPEEIVEEEVKVIKKGKDGKQDKEDKIEVQKYMFDLKCVRPKKGKKGKKKKKEPKKKKEKKKGKKKGDNAIQEEPIVIPKQCLETIYNTVLTLLQSGADVNFGEVPLPPLILSIFTKSEEIILELINFGANCNIRTSHHDGWLTPLHIIASLPISSDNILAAQVLLEHGAEPNLRANDQHWKEEKQMLLAGTDVPDFGKTPLQLLSIRYDFEDNLTDQFDDLCSLLINYGTDLTSTYLDHTYLTLAIVRGNIKLMKRILDTKLIDPNESLGNNMGVPLTVLVLKRYKNILSPTVCESVFNTLLDYLANPFTNVPNSEGNVIEFCDFENATPVADGGKKKKKPKKKTKKKSGHDQVIQLLHNCAERTLVEHIQGFVVKALYQYKIECGVNDPIFEDIVQFVTVPETAKILQILLDNKKIIPNKMFCYELLEYVMSTSKPPKKEKKKKGKTANKAVTPLSLVQDIEFSRRVIRKRNLFGLFLPEIDPNENKFKVCFECLHKINKILVVCPKCELVYFCSKECNLKNNKRNTRHKCKINFYDSELKKQLEREAKGEDIYYMGKFGCFNKYRQDIIKSTPNYFKQMAFTGDDVDADSPFASKFNKLEKAAEEAKAEAEKAGGHKSRKDKSDKESRGKSKSKSPSGKSKKDRSESRGKSRKDRSESRGKSERSKSKGSKKGDKSGKGGKDGKGGKGGKDGKGGKGGKGSKVGKDDARSKGEKSKLESGKGGKSDKETIGKGGTVDRSGDAKSGGVAGAGGGGDGKSKGFGGAGGDADGHMEGADSRDKSRMKDGVISDAYRNAISDTCSEFEFDMNFLKMFMPYCVFTDGQLYYKFERTNAFYKLTYSNV